ncbi:MAG: hypothetical protein ACO25L_03610 [Candidatus Nanopelagicales bacterium]
MDINKIIGIVRSLKEDTAITNVTGSSSLGYDPETETPPVKNKKKYIYPPQKGFRKLWQKK